MGRRVTCIVGIETDDGVVIGGDSAGTSPNFSFVQISDEKVWIDGAWIFGVCGNFRLSQLLRHALTLPQIPESDDDLEKFLVMDFMDAVRSTILDSGVVQSKNAVEQIVDSDFLVGVRGRLYLVQCDFSIIRSALGYYATGCGMDIALGSLHSTPQLAARTRAKKALEAAAQHNSAVAPPFTILEN